MFIAINLMLEKIFLGQSLFGRFCFVIYLFIFLVKMPGLSIHLLRHRRRRCPHLEKTKLFRCVLYASLAKEMIGIFVLLFLC